MHRNDRVGARTTNKRVNDVEKFNLTYSDMENAQFGRFEPIIKRVQDGMQHLVDDLMRKFQVLDKCQNMRDAKFKKLQV